MDVYVCTNHDKHWPVGVASLVIADSVQQATALLDEQLKGRGLKPSKLKGYTLRKVNNGKPVAMILCDGNT